MSTMWILSANSSFAKIYEVTGKGKNIVEIQHFDFPEGRMKSGEILNERPGRAFDRVGVGRHALGTEVDVHMHEQKVFAHQLAKALYDGKVNNSYEQIAIVAPPQFLGEIKLSLEDQVKKCVIKEVNKDLPIHLSEKERIEHLCKYLDLWNH